LSLEAFGLSVTSKAVCKVNTFKDYPLNAYRRHYVKYPWLDLMTADTNSSCSQ